MDIILNHKIIIFTFPLRCSSSTQSIINILFYRDIKISSKNYILYISDKVGMLKSESDSVGVSGVFRFLLCHGIFHKVFHVFFKIHNLQTNKCVCDNSAFWHLIAYKCIN